VIGRITQTLARYAGRELEPWQITDGLEPEPTEHRDRRPSVVPGLPEEAEAARLALQRRSELEVLMGNSSEDLHYAFGVDAGSQKSVKAVMDLRPTLQQILRNDNEAFVMTVRGFSMAPWYLPKDVVVVSPRRTPKHNRCVIVNYKNMLWLKQYSRYGDVIVFRSLNPEYGEFVCPADSDEYEILGTVVDVVRRYVSVPGADESLEDEKR